MKKIAIRLVLLGAAFAMAGALGMAETAPRATGHWEGKIQIPEHELGITVDLARDQNGVWIGSMTVLKSAAIDVPLHGVSVDESAVRFKADLPKNASFEGRLSANAGNLSGTASSAEGEAVPDRLPAFADRR